MAVRTSTVASTSPPRAESATRAATLTSWPMTSSPSELDLAVVQADPEPQAGLVGLADLEGGEHGRLGGAEGDQQPVAQGLHDPSASGADDRPDGAVVLLEQVTGGARRPPWP